MKSRRFRLFLAFLLGVGIAALVAWPFLKRPSRGPAQVLRAARTTYDGWFEIPVQRLKITDPVAQKIVVAAHAQEGDAYDAAYRTLSYPGGDVPKGSGACTDVVIRALRGAGIDLQKRVHDDMKRDFGRYPDPWKLGHTDKNIDHRRVPNLMTFFEKYGQSLPISTQGEALSSWKPGDIVCWKLEGGRWHTGIVSDGVGDSGQPMVIHNAWKCVEQDYLSFWPIVGHYRASALKM